MTGFNILQDIPYEQLIDEIERRKIKLPVATMFSKLRFVDKYNGPICIFYKIEGRVGPFMVVNSDRGGCWALLDNKPTTFIAARDIYNALQEAIS